MARTKKDETMELAVSETQTVSRSGKKDFVFAVGRRLSSVARIRLYAGRDSVTWNGIEAKKGEILINGKKAESYFIGEVAKAIYTEPLRVLNAQNKFIVTIRVEGGGHKGQLGAIVHGLSRALDKHDSKTHRTPLKKRGYLTRDARVRQRRKVGMGGKARRRKQSPKR